MKTVGSRIRLRRKDLGVTQSQLSQKVGVSQSLIAQWEKDGLALSEDNLQRTAEALDCSVAYLEGKEAIPLLAGELGERIKSTRLKARFSQRQLARRCGWKQGQKRISNYEKGHRAPKYADITTIAEALDVSPAWLAFGDDASAESSESIQEPTARYRSDIDDDNADWSNDLISLFYYPGKVDLTTLATPAAHKLYLSADVFSNRRIAIEDMLCMDVLDDSMQPVLPQGALVGIDRSATEVKDNDIYLVCYQAKLSLRMLKVFNDQIQLNTFDKANPFTISATELKILGRVFWYSVVS